MWHRFIREAGKLDWAQHRLWTTQPCLIPIALALVAGVLTSYIVCLLGIAGLPTREVAAHRTANTVLGGSLALLSFSTGLWVRRRPSAGGRRETPGPGVG